METIHPIRLKPGEQERLLTGHPWIYRNEVDVIPAAVEAGDFADVHDHRGRFLARGYLNPSSTIFIRLLARDRIPIDQAFFSRRIREAQAWREMMLGDLRTCLPQSSQDALLPGPAYRVVHGEADGLPGLVVDRYADSLAIQILTAGMERRRGLILHALEEIFHPRSIVARNDSTMREREGLPRERSVIRGDADQRPVVQLNGLEVEVDLLGGQKTGLFLDQTDNYRLLERLSPRARVLDCFCYTGLWALHAARFGAAHAIGVDQSATAVRQATALAERNGLQDRCSFEVGNAFDDLNARDRRRETFDVIVLDPPAFVKTRSRLSEAIRGYKEINLRAMRLLKAGGFLITCSCSHHLLAEGFRELLLEVAHDVQRSLKLVAQGRQGPDHPILLGMAETEYLKCLVLQVL